MASDLATTPSSGLHAQICGDAHLCNFGVFGSPERHLFFDVNDFDETAPGPWEWDVKRLAASLEIAARDNGFRRGRRTSIVRRAVRSYRETMRDFAQMSMLEVWYAHLDMDEMLPRFHSSLDRRQTPSVWKAIAKARAHDSVQAFAKLAEIVDGECRILHQPPLIMPVEDLVEGIDPEGVLEAMDTTSSAPIETRSETIAGACSSSTGSSTSLARWSAWEASGPKPGSCCSSTIRIRRCSCR